MSGPHPQSACPSWRVLPTLWGVFVSAWLIVQPAISMLAVAWWIGLYSPIFGAIMLIAPFGLRRRREDSGRAVPHAP